MIRCKACGYIMKKGKLGDRCPACGAPKTAFEPYPDPVAEPRRRILGLHIHPIAVHFPTSFSVAALVFSATIPFLPEALRTLLVSTTKVIAFFIPIVVIIAILVGWLDGVIRFRKIRNSQILQKKIVYGIVLFVVSAALALVVWIGEFGSPMLTVGALALSIVAVFLSGLLGILGMSITNAAFPGK
ncbi:MAG: hypothetical protein Q7R57_03845 [Dehalococcoidales bacterium]|nr:hypothetical protein [Dehalococcoidales bacterium]